MSAPVSVSVSATLTMTVSAVRDRGRRRGVQHDLRPEQAHNMVNAKKDTTDGLQHPWR
jgi:hypothetical protein